MLTNTNQNTVTPLGVFILYREALASGTVTPELEADYRAALAYGHGCEPDCIYANKGELQCNNIKNHYKQKYLDFKRMTLVELETALAMQKLLDSGVYFAVLDEDVP